MAWVWREKPGSERDDTSRSSRLTLGSKTISFRVARSRRASPSIQQKSSTFDFSLARGNNKQNSQLNLNKKKISHFLFSLIYCRVANYLLFQFFSFTLNHIFFSAVASIISR
jgi:hypothetical protein